MERTIYTKFFTYAQTNSGGSYDYNGVTGIGNYVIIEALDADHANLLAERAGIYFNGCESGIDCNCCGDRWHSMEHEESGKIAPMIYEYGLDVPIPYLSDTIAFIHYLDGSFEQVTLIRKEA